MAVEKCEVCGMKRSTPICLDCGSGLEAEHGDVILATYRQLAEWLSAASLLLAEMDPASEKYVQAQSKFARRHGVYRRIEDAYVYVPKERVAYDFTVVWARERGMLLVRDVFDGTWLEVSAEECPRWWKREAMAAKGRGLGWWTAARTGRAVA